MANKIVLERLCGRAVKKPAVMEFFKWGGISKPHVREFKAWVKSLGVNPKRDFQFTDNTLRVRMYEGIYYEVPKGYIIIMGEDGKFYPCTAYRFDDLYETLTT